jgi:hypothetical protein
MRDSRWSLELQFAACRFGESQLLPSPMCHRLPSCQAVCWTLRLTFLFQHRIYLGISSLGKIAAFYLVHWSVGGIDNGILDYRSIFTTLRGY